MVILVFSPTGHGPLIIKGNMGERVRQRDEETTTDEEGENDLTELSSMPKVQKVSQSIPRAKSQLVIPTSSPLG